MIDWQVFSDFVALTANQAVATACLIGMFFAWRSKNRSTSMQAAAVLFTVGFLAFTFGLFVRFEWWTPAILLSGEHRYHPFFLDYRALMYLFATPFMLWGIAMSLKALGNKMFSGWWFWVVTIGSGAIAGWFAL